MNSELQRRTFIMAGVGMSLGMVRTASAGSYLDRGSLLVTETRTEMSYLKRRTRDHDSALLVHDLTLYRVKAAHQMNVPKEVVQAHPHLLLMLENAERAANALVERKPESFLVFLRLVRDEEGLFVAILKQLGWTLPLKDAH